MNLITGAGSKSGGKKKSQQGKVNRMQRPIICICNDLYAPSLRTLRQQALTVSQPHVVPQSRYAHRTQKSQKCPITGRKPVRVSFLEVWHPKIYIFGIRPLDNRTVNWIENIYLLVFNLSSRGGLVVELWTFYVQVGDDTSALFDSDVGTIQGSVLGPILYALFISPI